MHVAEPARGGGGDESEQLIGGARTIVRVNQLIRGPMVTRKQLQGPLGAVSLRMIILCGFCFTSLGQVGQVFIIVKGNWKLHFDRKQKSHFDICCQVAHRP